MEKKAEKKAQTTNTSAEVAKVQTVNAEALALQKEIERKTKELQSCLADLTRKKKLSDNRDAFITACDNLEEAKKSLLEETDFVTSTHRLTFSGSKSYSNDDIFKISNRFVLLQFVDFITEKIHGKISDIEQELIK